MSRSFILLWILTGLSISSSAQNFREQFNKAADRKDTAAQQSILSKWKASVPEDPELYVAYYNYYVNKSLTEVLSIDKEPAGRESLEISEKEGKGTVGFINSRLHFDEHYLALGFLFIDTVIARYPNRLDMRFGKIYMLGQTGDFDRFTGEIIKVVDHSSVNKNKWTWTNDKLVEDPEKFMLNAIQDYVVQLFNAGLDQADHMKEISEAVLKYYPSHVESLSNLSVSYLIKKDFERALIPLFKAEKISPEDPVILSNIAWCYYQKGDPENASKYYERVVKYGDEEAKQFAREKLKELKKK